MNNYVLVLCRIQQAKDENAPVVDVDGSYLYQKQQKLIESGVQTYPSPLPGPPIHGWEHLTADNHQELSCKIPRVLPGKFILIIYIKALFVKPFRIALLLFGRRSWKYFAARWFSCS